MSAFVSSTATRGVYLKSISISAMSTSFGQGRVNSDYDHRDIDVGRPTYGYLCVVRKSALQPRRIDKPEIAPRRGHRGTHETASTCFRFAGFSASATNSLRSCTGISTSRPPAKRTMTASCGPYATSVTTDVTGITPTGSTSRPIRLFKKLHNPVESYLAV